MFERPAPSDSPLLVAGDARGRIEDGAQTVAAGRERIAGRPLVEKEIASGLRCLDVGFRRPSYRSNQPVARYPKGTTTVSSTIQHSAPQNRFMIWRPLT